MQESVIYAFAALPVSYWFSQAKILTGTVLLGKASLNAFDHQNFCRNVAILAIGVCFESNLYFWQFNSKMPAPAPPAPENGAPRTELQELQYKAGQVTDEASIIIKSE